MKKIHWLILLAVLVALTLTCPKRDAHLEAFTQEMKTAMANETGKVLGQNATPLASLATNFASNLLVDNLLTVSNYGIVSVGRLQWNGEEYPVSVGLLGHVFTVNHEQIEQKVEQAVREKVPFL